MVEKSSPVSVENAQKVSILDIQGQKITPLLPYSLKILFQQTLIIW